MSFWARVGVKIQDMQCFRAACQKHGVQIQMNEDQNFKVRGHEVHATLHDQQGRSSAYLVKDGGAFRLMIDNDAGYSSLTQRLGQNGGVLMRDYTQGVVQRNISNAGGMITQTQEHPDGSVTLKVAVGM